MRRNPVIGTLQIPTRSLAVAKCKVPVPPILWTISVLVKPHLVAFSVGHDAGVQVARDSHLLRPQIPVHRVLLPWLEAADERERRRHAVAAEPDVRHPAFGAKLDDSDDMARADKVTLRHRPVAQADRSLAVVGREAEAAEDVEPEDGRLEAVSPTSAAGRADELLVQRLGVDVVDVARVVMQREVLVGDGGDLQAVEESERLRVAGEGQWQREGDVVQVGEDLGGAVGRAKGCVLECGDAFGALCVSGHLSGPNMVGNA